MSDIPGLINRFIRFSAVDGPGNRFVIFLQGCNLNCINCHNPHTIGDCNLCGFCIMECPAGALSNIKDQSKINCEETLCLHCDTCLKVCPENSTPHSRKMTVDEMLAEIRKTASFLSGITVSGGEPTQQPEFVFNLFSAIKSDPQLSHLTTFIDSNGKASLETWNFLSPMMDQAMIDLKALDEETHVKITGHSNRMALQTIYHLHQLNKLYEVRLLLIPGINDHQTTLKVTASYLKNIDPELRIKLIAFRKHGVREEFHHLKEMQKESIFEIQRYFHTIGLKNTVNTELESK